MAYAIELCEGLPYGVIEVSDVEFRPTKYARKSEKASGARSKAGAYVFVRKRASRINAKYPYPLDRFIYNRMGSDLVREKLIGYKVKLGRIIILFNKVIAAYRNKYGKR